MAIDTRACILSLLRCLALARYEF